MRSGSFRPLASSRSEPPSASRFGPSLFEAVSDSSDSVALASSSSSIKIFVLVLLLDTFMHYQCMGKTTSKSNDGHFPLGLLKQLETKHRIRPQV